MEFGDSEERPLRLLMRGVYLWVLALVLLVLQWMPAAVQTFLAAGCTGFGFMNVLIALHDRREWARKHQQ